MPSWTKEDLHILDLKYAKEGVHLHQRPFRAATELLGSAFRLSGQGNPEVKAIMDAYTEMLPEVNSSWPGKGIGLAVSVDSVRKLTLAVVFGTAGHSIEPWVATGFGSREEWWNWCRNQENIAAEASFAFADLHDFSYGIDEIESVNSEAVTLLRMAQSNLEDVANILKSTFNVDSVIQQICMVVELTLKGALVWDGADINSFKGKEGHQLSTLANRMISKWPHRDDLLVKSVIPKLPNYVNSRYSPAGLTRLEVVRLALGVQFIAASTLRRITGVDLAIQMESGGWPAPRRAFFIE